MAGDLPWSAQQREWLQALGHDVLRLAAHPGPIRPDDAHGATMAPPAASPARADSTAATATFLRALARAAGRGEDDPELLQALPDLASLRSPAARRALWPRLRALRRRTPR